MFDAEIQQPIVNSKLELEKRETQAGTLHW